MTPNLIFHYQLELEHKILIILFIVSYIMAMWIQVKDPNIEVHWSDFFIIFFTGAIGAVIAYFTAEQWLNVGFRMAITVIVSLMFPRAFMFLLSKEAQQEFSQGFFKGVLSILKKFVRDKSDENGGNNNL